MSSDAVDLTVIHNDDAIRILHTGDTLGDDEFRRSRDLLQERLTDLCVGGCIYGAGAVVENQDLRFLQEGSGDTETLF